MNVKYGMLPTLLLLGALAACAPGYMSKEEAVKAGNEIKAFHETSTFAYPHDQVTFTDDSYSSKYETHFTVRFIKDVYASRISERKTLDASSGVTATANSAEYVYSQNDHYYDVSVTDGVAVSTELTAAEYQLRFYGTAAVPGFATALLATITEAGDGSYEALEDFLAANDPAYSAPSPKSEISSAKSGDSTYTYTGGNGRFVLNAQTNLATSSIQVAMTSSYRFYNSYPESIFVSSDVTEASASSTSTYNIKETTTFSWKECTAVYPDVSKASSK
jgi:hypothetical protein